MILIRGALFDELSDERYEIYEMGYFLTGKTHAIMCCYNESSSMYCLIDNGTRNNSKSSWWGKTKMSISQIKPFSSLMLQFRLKIKEVQINEETFSSIGHVHFLRRTI